MISLDLPVAQIIQRGISLTVLDGNLDVRPRELVTPEDLNFLRKHKLELIEFLQRQNRTPPNCERTTFEVNPNHSSIDTHSWEIEHFICGIWDLGCALFAEIESGSLVVDAPSDALDHSQWAFLAERAGEIFEAIRWLGEMEKRALYKAALLWWLRHDDFKKMPSLVVAGRLIREPWSYAQGLFFKNQMPWREIVALVEALALNFG